MKLQGWRRFQDFTLRRDILLKSRCSPPVLGDPLLSEAGPSPLLHCCILRRKRAGGSSEWPQVTRGDYSPHSWPHTGFQNPSHVRSDPKSPDSSFPFGQAGPGVLQKHSVSWFLPRGGGHSGRGLGDRLARAQLLARTRARCEVLGKSLNLFKTLCSQLEIGPSLRARARGGVIPRRSLAATPQRRRLSEGCPPMPPLVSALMAPSGSAEVPPAAFCVLVPWGHRMAFLGREAVQLRTPRTSVLPARASFSARPPSAAHAARAPPR